MGGPRPLPLPPGPCRAVTMSPKAHSRGADCAKDILSGQQALCKLHLSDLACVLSNALIQAYSNF